MLHVLHINVAGLLILAISFGIAFGAGWIAGFSDEGRLMVIAGALVALVDFTFRVTRENGHWFSASRGGALFFLPVWLFGVLWAGLGTYYVMTA
jgi:hypothetical protein